MSRWVATIIAAVLSAYASAVVAQFGTPIDNALPWIAAGVVVVAAMSAPAISLAVPLLIGGEIAIVDERLRLVWFGVVLAIAAVAALTKIERPVVIAIASILLLRWIPIASITVWRELLLLAIAVAIVCALRETPLGVAIAVATALFTPLIPLRTIGYAFAILAASAIVWLSGKRIPRLTLAASFAIAIMLLFFAWSGVFARATLLALRGLPVNARRTPMNMALAPGQSIAIDVPADARAVILSGANIARLEPGTIVGRIMWGRASARPGRLKPAPTLILRVGDVADWGFLRREHFHGSRNHVPHNAAGELRGYGQSAWIDGAARFPASSPTMFIAADAKLPKDARLQIDAFESKR